MIEDGADMISSLSLRDITYEARVKIIESRVDDVAFQQILKLMLHDKEKRPTARQLLQHPTIKFFESIVISDEAVSQSSGSGTLEAYISALHLGNKNKALNAFTAIF